MVRAHAIGAGAEGLGLGEQFSMFLNERGVQLKDVLILRRWTSQEGSSAVVEFVYEEPPK